MGNGSSTRSEDVSFDLSESESDIATKLKQTGVADGNLTDNKCLMGRKSRKASFNSSRRRKSPFTKGWAKSSPKKGKERAAMLKRCGAGCFLLPNKKSPGKSKFPVCAKKSCKKDCKGVLSALMRAQQSKRMNPSYIRVAKKAKSLYAKHKCGGKSRKSKRSSRKSRKHRKSRKSSRTSKRTSRKHRQSRKRVNTKKYRMDGSDMKLIPFVEDRKHLLHWNILSGNKNAIDLLKEHIIDNPGRIDIDIDWSVLSGNKNAIDLLMQYPAKIDWYWLSGNKNAIDLLRQHPDKINWSMLSGNKSPGAIRLLSQNPEKIDWTVLSTNPNAIQILEQNPDKIDWNTLSSNPEAIHLIEWMLEQNPDKINGGYLSENKNAIHLLAQNPDKIDWRELSSNPNAIGLLIQNLDREVRGFPAINKQRLSENKSPDAISLLENRLDMIDWDHLSRNPNAIHLLERNPDEIDWEILSENPNIFENDLMTMDESVG